MYTRDMIIDGFGIRLWERVLFGERVERGFEYRVEGENERERESIWTHVSACRTVNCL